MQKLHAKVTLHHLVLTYRGSKRKEILNKSFKFASMFISDIIIVILLCRPTPQQDKVNHVFVSVCHTKAFAIGSFQKS